MKGNVLAKAFRDSEIDDNRIARAEERVINNQVNALYPYADNAAKVLIKIAKNLDRNRDSESYIEKFGYKSSEGGAFLIWDWNPRVGQKEEGTQERFALDLFSGSKLRIGFGYHQTLHDPGIRPFIWNKKAENLFFSLDDEDIDFEDIGGKMGYFCLTDSGEYCGEQRPYEDPGQVLAEIVQSYEGVRRGTSLLKRITPEETQKRLDCIAKNRTWQFK